LQADSDGCTVTGLSKSLGEEKYTVSRVISELEKEMLIDKSDCRHPILTDKGKKEAERYSERINIAIRYLLYKGVDMENAKNDAFYWALYCSEPTMAVIRAVEQRYQVKHELSESKCFGGLMLAKRLKNGAYKLPFIIYRDNFKNGINLSSVNNFFVHPCVLNIKNGTGNVQLCLVSGTGNAYWRLKSLKYYYQGKYYATEIYGDVVQFPIEPLKFENLGSEICQVLHGSVCIRLEYYNNEGNYFNALAMFTILI